MTSRQFAAVLFLLAGALAFCGSASAATSRDAEVELQFWNALVYDPPKSAVAAMVEQFNAQHPTIHINLLQVPQMEQKLLTAVVGRVPPDVAIFDRFRIAGYADRGAFLRLDELAAQSEIKREDFFEAPWDECVYKGGLYGIPYQTDVRVLYYNKELFRKAGLDPDRPPRTWKELREFSARLTKRDKKGRLLQTGFVPYTGFGNTWLYLFGWQKGATYLSEDGRTATLDDPKLIEALEWLRDFTSDYTVADLNLFSSGFGVEELDPFLTGQIGMTGEEVFMLSRIRRYNPGLEFGMAPLPWPEDGEHVTWSGGFAFVVPEGAGQPEASMEFIAFMVSAEAQLAYGKASDQLPANKVAASNPYFTEDPQWSIFVEEMAYSRHRPVTSAGGVLWDEMRNAWELGAGESMAPEAALGQAQKNVQAELDRIAEKQALAPVNWILVGTILATIVVLVLVLRLRKSWKEIRRTSVLRKEALAGYLFSLPAIIGLTVFWIGPILVAVVYSFCHYDVLSPARWSGLQNYHRLFFEDPLFWKSLYNTFYFVVLAVPTSILGSLGLALLLNQEFCGRSIWRTLFYLPSIVPLVALTLLFVWLFNGQFGLFNVILDAVGLPRLPWLASPKTSKLSLVIMNFWTIGAGMVIFLAGLQGVPRQLHESAMIDGAGVYQRFLHVTVPCLLPTIFFMVIINTITCFQIFTQAFLITGNNSPGAPENSLMFYVFYLFIQGFTYFNMGYASALAWIMFVIIVIVALLLFKIARKFGYEDVMR